MKTAASQSKLRKLLSLLQQWEWVVFSCERQLLVEFSPLIVMRRRCTCINLQIQNSEYRLTFWPLFKGNFGWDAKLFNSRKSGSLWVEHTQRKFSCTFNQFMLNRLCWNSFGLTGFHVKGCLLNFISNTIIFCRNSCIGPGDLSCIDTIPNVFHHWVKTIKQCLNVLFLY